MKVSDIMEKKLLTVGPNTYIKDAHDLMIEKRIRHILIIDNDKLLGIISDRDIKMFMSRFAGSDLETERDKGTLFIKVSSIMIKEIVSVSYSDSLKSCITKMINNTIHAVPVLDEEKKLVGIITSTDMLKLLASNLSKEA